MKVALAAMPLLCVAVAWPQAAHGQDAEPVRIERDGLKLETAPLGADQVRAFFLARGFASADTEHVVETACLFRSAIGSSFGVEGSPDVSVTLTEWRVTPVGGKPAAPKAREDWEAIWKSRGVPEEAATAFYWSLFPTEQTFFATDYNWGFLTFGLPPGTTFDLSLSWRTGGTSHAATIKGLQCAR